MTDARGVVVDVLADDCMRAASAPFTQVHDSALKSRRFRCRNRSGENLFVGQVFAIICIGIIVILVHDISGQIDTGKHSLATRVGKKRCVGQNGRRSLGTPTDRSGGNGRVTS